MSTMAKEHYPNPGFTDTEFAFLKRAKEDFHEDDLGGMGQVSWAQFFVHCAELQLDEDYSEYRKEHENTES